MFEIPRTGLEPTFATSAKSRLLPGLLVAIGGENVMIRGNPIPSLQRHYNNRVLFFVKTAG
jgi:hypothetical protein